MSRVRMTVLAVGLSVVLLAGACSSSKSGDSAKTGTNVPTYTVGVLTDLTGLGGSPTVLKGIEAGVGVAGTEGYRIKYVVGDTQSSPTQALTAAQKLVEQDHVFAVIAISGLAFAASKYLTSNHIPVVGVAEDSTEWITSSNMFSIIGAFDYTKVISTDGEFFKKVGVTRLGTLGYSIAPGSTDSAKASAISAEAAGVKVPYLNPEFPLSVNVGPVAIAMKNDEINGLTTAVEANVNYLLLTSLQQQGVALKAALLPTGYGGDLDSAGAPAQHAAQGAYFSLGQEPVEMHTAATEKFQNALSKYAGLSGEPGFSEYWGYESIDAFVTGLKAAGAHPTQASFINAMLGIHSYNAAGLYGSHSVSFAMAGRGQTSGADDCLWITRYQGSSFQLVPGMDPLCGSLLPGKTV